MNYLNGKFIVNPFSEGLLYGAGCFETMLVKDGRIIDLDRHYKRLVDGCKVLEINFNMELENLKKHLDKYVDRVGKKDYAIRITISKKSYTYDFMISKRDIPYNKESYEKGFNIKFGDILKNQSSPLTYIKSTCYSENLISLRGAKKDGYDEVVHLNLKDEVCEGAISNIFFVKDDIVKTPKISCGLLSGTMRAEVIDYLNSIGVTVEEGSYTKEDLIEADEIFMTNSLMRVMPVTSLQESDHYTRKIYNILKDRYL